MDIQLYDKLNNPVEAIDRIGEMFARSGMFGCDRTEQGKVLAMVCIAEKKSPVEILREYHIIEGRLSDRADAMLAKYRARGGKHKIVSRTPDRAEISLTIDGETQTFSLTWDECSKEPFVWSNKTNPDGSRVPKKNWATPRARMQTLWARVVSDGVRTMAPEIVAGIYTPEEIEDHGSPSVSATEIRLAPSPAPSVESPRQIATTPPATVIDAALSAPDTESAMAAQGIAPSAPPVPTPPPPQPSPSPARPPSVASGLAPETISELESAIGEHGPAAMDWMVRQGWLTAGQDMSALTPQRATRIIKQRDSFIRAITGGAR
jgi:hypothetical protein